MENNDVIAPCGGVLGGTIGVIIGVALMEALELDMLFSVLAIVGGGTGGLFIGVVIGYYIAKSRSEQATLPIAVNTAPTEQTPIFTDPRTPKYNPNAQTARHQF